MIDRAEIEKLILASRGNLRREMQPRCILLRCSVIITNRLSNIQSEASPGIPISISFHGAHFHLYSGTRDTEMRREEGNGERHFNQIARKSLLRRLGRRSPPSGPSINEEGRGNFDKCTSGGLLGLLLRGIKDQISLKA